MDEILYALKENIVGLNCGRWDYIFSYIKRLGRSPDRLTPDRALMTMDKAFLAAYSLRLVATCHRRGAFAMGGMSAFIPVKGDEAAEPRGAWTRSARTSCARWPTAMTAPGSRTRRWCPCAMEAFEAMPGPNQLSKMPEHVPGRDEMLELHEGARTEAGARENIRVGVQYLAAWLGGQRRGPAL